MKTAAFLAVLVIATSTVAACARPVIGPDQYGQIYIPAQRKDHLYQLRCELGGLVSIRGHKQTQDEFYLNKTLSDEEKQQLRASKTRFVTTARGGDATIFDDPSLLPYLQHVSLMSDQTNAQCLASLARHYPSLSSLSIGQRDALDKQSIEHLRAFKHLTTLELTCQVGDADALKTSLPKSLISLDIRQNLDLPKLPALQELIVRNCTLEDSFLGRLQAPELTYMNLIHVDFSEKFFCDIKHLRHLRKLSLCQTPFDLNGVAQVLLMPYLAVQAQP